MSSDKITVLHLIGATRVGGAERQLFSLVSQFDPNKFRIIVATMQPDGGLEEEFRGSGVEVKCLNFRMRGFVSGVRLLASLLRQEKVDILHTHMYHASWYGRIAGVYSGVPVMIATEHGHGPWKKLWHVAFERWALKRTAMRIAVSNGIAETLRSREKVPGDKLVVIPNGVEVERFKAGVSERKSFRSEFGLTDEIVVGTVGRLVEPKSLHIFIEAALGLQGVRILIVGDGPLRTDLEACAERLGISGRVIFAGERSDISAVLAGIDIFVLSSKLEGLPIALLEAMAAGKPIVATKVGGILEAVRDGQEALLVEPNDPTALADGIRRLIDDSKMASGLGQRAAERAAKEFSIAVTARKLEDLYCSLITGKTNE